MKLITILKSMISKILVSIGILFLLFSAMRAFGDERLDTCEFLLKKANEQMKTDNQIIHDLNNIMDEMELRIAILEQENEELKIRIQKQKGWYIGGLSGYPFPSFSFVGMRKFNRWGILATTGYINGFNISAGFVVHFRE